MSELPPDLPRLRTLQTYLRLQLTEVNERIRQLEQTTTRQRTSASPASPQEQEESQAKGTDALRWWRFIPNPRNGGGVLHRGDCRRGAGGALLSETEARLILEEEGVRPCDRCCPEIRLEQ